MGLDNGIILYTPTPIENIPKELSDRLSDICRTENGYEYGICYWRKCNNIRRNIGDELFGCWRENYTKENLDIEEVKYIWNVIYHLNKRYMWDQIDNDSMWYYDEMKDQLDDDLLYLEWLIWFMRRNECRVDFYDSW